MTGDIPLQSLMLPWVGRGGSLLRSTNTNAEKNTFTTHKHTNTNTNTNCLIEVSVVPSEAREMRQYL